MDWGGPIVAWTDHPSLRARLGEVNRLRVIMRGDLIRVYINGLLATSIHDARFRSGTIRLIVSPSSREPLTVAFSDLQLRDVK
jgi:hypothetical protein